MKKNILIVILLLVTSVALIFGYKQKEKADKLEADAVWQMDLIKKYEDLTKQNAETAEGALKLVMELKNDSTRKAN